MDDTNGVDVERNAFWLLGVEDDFYTIQQIKVSFEASALELSLK